jgi:hypothetical protein
MTQALAYKAAEFFTAVKSFFYDTSPVLRKLSWNKPLNILSQHQFREHATTCFNEGRKLS